MQAEVIRAKPEPKKPVWRTAKVACNGTTYRFNNDRRRFEILVGNGSPRWIESCIPATPSGWDFLDQRPEMAAQLLDLLLNPAEPQEDPPESEGEITEVVLRMNREEVELLTQVAWKSDVHRSHVVFSALPDELTKDAHKKWGSCG